MSETAPQTPRKSGWSPERRAKHAAAIRRWAPWTKSTGPKTTLGKAISSRNAVKHGERTIGWDPLSVAVRKQKRLHAYAARYAKRFTTNELLHDPLFAFLEAAIRKGTIELLDLFRPEIMQKTCFLGPPGANS